MLTREELVNVLKAGYRSMIVEADEWRPLVDHILELARQGYFSDTPVIPGRPSDEEFNKAFTAAVGRDDATVWACTVAYGEVKRARTSEAKYKNNADYWKFLCEEWHTKANWPDHEVRDPPMEYIR